MDFNFLQFFQRKPNNIYRNSLLQFTIEKPADWVFVPQKWAFQFDFKLKWQINKFKKVLSQGVIPFVYFYKRISSKEYPCPTVQCGCRLNHLSELATRAEQLEKVVEEVTQSVKSCEIIQTDPEYIVSGHRGMMVQIKFAVRNERKQKLDCIATTIVIEYHEYLIVIGMTGSQDSEYRCEKEFEEILGSIEIG